MHVVDSDEVFEHLVARRVDSMRGEQAEEKSQALIYGLQRLSRLRCPIKLQRPLVEEVTHEWLKVQDICKASNSTLHDIEQGLIIDVRRLLHVEDE